MKKIAVVVFSLEAGGTEKFATLLADGLTDFGYQVTLVSLVGRERAFFWPTACSDVVCLSLNQINRKGLIGRLKAIRATIRDLGDIIDQRDVESVIGLGWLTNVVVAYVGKRKRISVVISERSDPRMNAIPLIWRFARYSYRLADALVVQTEAIVQPASRWISRSRIHVIPNPVDPQIPIGQWRGGSSTTIASVGRLSAEKGQDVLLRAIAILKPILPEIRAHFVGDGPSRASLEHLSARLGIAENVEYWGRLSNPFEDLLDDSCFVLSSRYEGFPNSLIEAMAIGFPCIATDCPSGPSDLLRAGAGLLVPSENPVELARAIRQVFDEKDLASDLSKSAQARVERLELSSIIKSWSVILSKETNLSTRSVDS